MGSPRLLFVMPGKLGDALFALPTLVASMRAAAAHGIREATWVCRPYTANAETIVRAGLWAWRDRVAFRVFDRCPHGKPDRGPPPGPDASEPMSREWAAWSPALWLREFPGHVACVNATMREVPPAGKHVAAWIAESAGMDVGARVMLDREALANLAPGVPDGAVVWQPFTAEPEKTPIDMAYARMPEGTVILRRRGEPGLPSSVIGARDYDEWIDASFSKCVSLVARARLVVGVSSLWALLAALCGVPAVVVRQVTDPERYGIGPWGGLDLCGLRDPGVLEDVVARALVHRDVNGAGSVNAERRGA